MYKATRGCVIADVLPMNEQLTSGLLIINRKEIPIKALVLSVGSSYVERKKTIEPPCKEGDVIYFKRYSSKSFDGYGTGYLKGGKAKIAFKDIIALEPCS